MGACGSNPEDTTPVGPDGSTVDSAMSAERLKAERLKDKDISLKQKEAEKKDSTVRKLLLLGAGESGKSTLFKQAKTLYTSGFSDEEKLTYRALIHRNVMTEMSKIAKKLPKELTIPPGMDEKEVYGTVEKFTTIKFSFGADLNLRTAAEVDLLWKLKETKKVWERRLEYNIQENIHKFLDRVMELVDESYVPTLEDILYCRIKTTGVHEMEFELKKQKMKMVDVGGQRSERKKWITQFTNCHAVIFVAALSEYDQKIEDDSMTNRLDESVALFEEICKYEHLQKMALILFLNKDDLFREKIKNIDTFKAHFPDFDESKALVDFKSDVDNLASKEKTSDMHYLACLCYIQRKFLERNDNDARPVYVHVTCALKQDNVSKVFQDLSDIILRLNITRIGLTV